MSIQILVKEIMCYFTKLFERETIGYVYLAILN